MKIRDYFKIALSVCFFSIAATASITSAASKHVNEPIVLLTSNGDKAPVIVGSSFGAVAKGGAVQSLFLLKNTTTKTVVISRIDPTCECVSGKLIDDKLKLPLSLKAGASVNVKMGVDTSKLEPGSVKKELWIYTNGDWKHVAAILQMSGKIGAGAK
jgi:hypothetical protein